MRAARNIALTLFVAAAAIGAGCAVESQSLNPQPLPPGEDPNQRGTEGTKDPEETDQGDPSTAGGESSSGSSTSSGSSSSSSGAGPPPDPNDAGADEDASDGG